MQSSAGEMLFPTDFSLLLVLGAPKLGVRAATGFALRLGWFQAALGSVESRALKLQGEVGGSLGGWCAAAGASGPARLCSQPPLHMQRGSLAARGGSSAESGKPAKGGAGRGVQGRGWDPRAAARVGIRDLHLTPTLPA